MNPCEDLCTSCAPTQPNSVNSLYNARRSHPSLLLNRRFLRAQVKALFLVKQGFQFFACLFGECGG
jgi:hypothetical protein